MLTIKKQSPVALWTGERVSLNFTSFKTKTKEKQSMKRKERKVQAKKRKKDRNELVLFHYTNLSAHYRRTTKFLVNISTLQELIFSTSLPVSKWREESPPLELGDWLRTWRAGREVDAKMKKREKEASWRRKQHYFGDLIAFSGST